MSLPISYIKKLRTSMHDFALRRRDIINQAGDALHHAKRAIFALHRDDKVEARKKLAQSKKILRGLEKKYAKAPKLLEEGSYKAALEEFVEANLFYQFVDKKTIETVPGLNVPSEMYIAGLCDLPGELYRYAIKSATERKIDLVKRCAQVSDDIIGELIEFNLTSYLRTKFDQAKQTNHKLEKVVYEVSLRNAG